MIDSSELDALVVVMPEDLHHPMVKCCSSPTAGCRITAGSKHLLENGYIGMSYHAYFTWPTGWYPAQQPNSYFWWADARRAKGAVNTS